MRSVWVSIMKTGTWRSVRMRSSEPLTAVVTLPPPSGTAAPPREWMKRPW